MTINYTLAGERTYKFTSSFSGSHIGVIYEWHFSDGTTSALAEPTHTFAGLGPYFASLTVRNDCGGETSEILNLCIPPSITGVSVSVDGYRVIVTVNYLGSYEHCVIDWNDGSSPTEGISQVHTYPPMPRTYTLTVTLSGCGQTVIVAANVAVPVGGPIDG
ncbi:hypothetical protein KIH39_00085 [Telmatocola sphagniphila]|uniref:PKD domain-containing protein n=1 Tax=Telmatocola sphagniphila TaxID=1123043 RepID=A0A8E6B5K5_9BACT|nr:PKD domain-containing protein [Telmatocola sphagniphila]QVL32353.1 hypothetical protein KIH39_00085 [Telmatocola sphagniphila]